MTTRFKIVPHLTTGVEMVEVWIGNEFVAAIYVGERNVVRVASKYLVAATIDWRPPAVVNVQLSLEAGKKKERPK
jgi:hypothetical protein